MKILSCWRSLCNSNVIFSLWPLCHLTIFSFWQSFLGMVLLYYCYKRRLFYPTALCRIIYLLDGNVTLAIWLYCSTFMPSFYVRQVPKDNPVLRVLFHTANYHNIGHNAQICIVMTASMETNSGNSRKKKDYKRPKPAFGSAKAKQSRMRMSVSQICDLRREAKDGTCLGQLTLPSSWWMPFTQQRLQKRPPKSASASYSTVQPEAPADLGIMKQPKVFVDVKYSVFETRAGAPCEQQSQGHKAQAKGIKGASFYLLKCTFLHFI